MPHSTPATRTFLILAAAAAGMATLLALLPAAGHDQMWLLYAANLHLHGAPLYGPEIFETNPPLILWLSTLPAALANLTGLPPTALGKLLLVLLQAALAALCLRLLKSTPPPPAPPQLEARPGAPPIAPQISPSSEAQPLPLPLPALAFAAITITAVLPARDFGQRDHLLALFLLPYLCAAAIRLSARPIPTWLATLAGSLALLGLALKPHQILVPVAVEATLLLHTLSSRKSQSTPRQILLRPELLAVIASGLLFLLAIHRFAPLYFSVILPIARDTYWAYGQRTLPQLLADSPQLHLLALLDLGLVLFTGWRRTLPLARVFLIAGLAATLAFYLQGTGWYYQQLPALTFLAFALTFLLSGLAIRHHLTLPHWTPKAAAALALLALALTTHFMGYPFTPARSFPVDTPDPRFFAALAPGAPVLTLSPTVDYTIQPIFKFHLTLAQRYPALLMLPALLRAEDPGPHPPAHIIPPDRLAALDALQHRFMLEDLERWHPALILVERCQDPAVHCQVLEERHDDLLAFFLRDPAFRAAFAPYRRTATYGAFDAYTPTPDTQMSVFGRQPSP